MPKILSETIIPSLKQIFNTGLSKKQDKLTSGQNIKTINDEPILGSGNIDIPTTTIVQSTGTSTTSVMSQKAVSDIFGTTLRTVQEWSRAYGGEPVDITALDGAVIELGAASSTLRWNTLPQIAGYFQIKKGTASSIDKYLVQIQYYNGERWWSLAQFAIENPSYQSGSAAPFVPIQDTILSLNSQPMNSYENYRAVITPSSSAGVGAQVISHKIKIVQV